MSLSRRDFLKVVGVTVGSALLPIQVAQAASTVNPDDYIGMLYDATKCVGCNACTNACRQWNKTTPEVDASGLYDAPQQLSSDTWTLIQIYQESETSSFVKRQCMHCVNPACVSGCPVEALQKSPAGPVTYDPDRCIGCRYCMYTCPFHVPRFSWKDVIPRVTKCTLCADRLAEGNGPACAESCPTGALIWGKRGALIVDAENRLATEPTRYVDKVYGKEDAGGTSVMYLAAVSFENLGLPKVGNEPIPDLSETVGNMFLPSIIVGGPLFLAALHSIAKRGGLIEES